MRKPTHKTRNPGAIRGFTLIELLVTITIIVALAALALVGYRRIRSSASMVTSTQNLRLLQMANVSFAGDNNGIYCPVFSFDGDGANVSSWFKNPEFLVRLTGREPSSRADGSLNIQVPVTLLDPVAYRSGERLHRSIIASYGYCDTGFSGSGFGGADSKHAFRTTEVVSPERSAAFFTATDWMVQYGSSQAVWTTSDYEQVEGYSGNQRMAARHKGKVLVAYYDGHVGQLTPGDFRKIDAEGGASNIFWNADGE